MRKIWLASGAVLLLFLIALAGSTREVHESYKGDNLESAVMELDLAIGDYTLRPGTAADDVYAEVDGEYDEDRFDYTLDFRERHNRGDLLFSSEGRTGRHSDHGRDSRNAWDFRVNPAVTTDMTVDVGAADAEFELGDLTLREFDLDVGAADTRVSFSKPNRCALELFRVDAGACELDMRQLGNAKFEHFEFDGGVGSFSLDFSGDFDYEATADISIGLGAVEIVLPEDLGVRIEAEENWLSSVDLPRRHFDRVDDDVYETENYDTAKGRLKIILSVGLGSADIVVK